VSTISRKCVMAMAAAVTLGSLAVAADVLSQFQLTQEEAHAQTFDTIWRGSPPDATDTAGIFRRLSPEARAAAVTAMAAVVRGYAESDAFRERYATERQERRPHEIQSTSTTAGDVEKQMGESEKALAQMQAAMKDMPPEMRKMMEAAMKEAGAEGSMDETIAAGRKSAREGAEQQKQAIADTNAAAAKSQKSAQAFDAEYPANPERFVARRLREFLDLAASVPDTAALVRRGDKMVFADPQLEKKPDFWKQLYRAGRPARDAARAAAEAWLKALERGVA
jgi:hypothetical protein